MLSGGIQRDQYSRNGIREFEDDGAEVIPYLAKSYFTYLPMCSYLLKKCLKDNFMSSNVRPKHFAKTSFKKTSIILEISL